MSPARGSLIGRTNESSSTRRKSPHLFALSVVLSMQLPLPPSFPSNTSVHTCMVSSIMKYRMLVRSMVTEKCAALAVSQQAGGGLWATINAILRPPKVYKTVSLSECYYDNTLTRSSVSSPSSCCISSEVGSRFSRFLNDWTSIEMRCCAMPAISHDRVGKIRTQGAKMQRTHKDSENTICYLCAFCIRYVLLHVSVS